MWELPRFITIDRMTEAIFFRFWNKLKNLDLEENFFRNGF
ncbi:hypothetical protein LEP1GSC161_1783 [Leptospira santarosai str. CBC1416]|uniref:Uncharacterized protein n=4 Tax=Leptospira santarosai TaxID=28183 RepID=M6USB5_9LEPT|nr:hypothetical protein LEP1GSC179_3606 [Leptospira santarosai str. MOR084]EKO79415.1 hypothetical protein LEP1GSC068_2294 [Leptospira sp. Fiocruz LV3954]EKR91880.1 hypothetical protein LEP1GSC163_3640 [Leptospira santarosai str. CBC379]EKS08230.1 hypothetical protein LEP1GSC071_2091 [Leptospira santarosai str. JET]EMF90781.1 hypothetical protein LEP1GSC005_3583 [Leptospira santarosai str. ST188]EMI66595.1 hypothetical protein LEP1GSC076_0326 [Leptospira sp. Fiocruz LV4135]EMJ49198.1 hypothet